MGFALERVGRWTEEQAFEVEADRARAYAAATNDPVPAHVTGELAPPVFAVVPIWPVLAEAVAAVTPLEVMLQAVHGEQDLHLHRPIVPGATLRSRAAPVGIHVKPSGTAVVTRTETRDEQGALVNEQWSVSFVRGVGDGESVGETAPPHRFPDDLRGTEPLAEVRQRLDDDQTFRYAEASGDHMPIHLDDTVARSVGLPGIIVHGLCTMAHTSWAAVTELAGGDPARLRRLAVRFSKPVLPGQEITTRFWVAGQRDGRALFAYETTNADGDVVVRDGLAEVGAR
ncbi:MAG: MaoC/PaaZ C-terminal domain-containing protein [Acidimicrobiia bacterium]|nr:MaoC/PaaZ C-terminal domain-containing protein [Acidimicrobiia bacterium]